MLFSPKALLHVREIVQITGSELFYFKTRTKKPARRGPHHCLGCQISWCWPSPAIWDHGGRGTSSRHSPPKNTAASRCHSLHQPGSSMAVSWWTVILSRKVWLCRISLQFVARRFYLRGEQRLSAWANEKWFCDKKCPPSSYVDEWFSARERALLFFIYILFLSFYICKNMIFYFYFL